ncbi:chemotaxis protein CheW [Inmirania thermothiophila]|uniref:Twitching motility protein PilI n=1 Tax=Inmirania thermothiophila TaxID=1750597 RepID=A0A3N1Y5T5_9GAMM|nr:chemotaxis protein CheW [Inmirania thermothiophila]ROR34174.1 twitching motility protein PilI [Inmirania thermothiophila]
MDPLALLQEAEARFRGRVEPVRLEGAERETWSGLGFRLGALRLAAPLAEVAEILEPPRLTRVPHTKPWLLGVGNVRGTLLPVVDLHGLLYDTPTPPGPRRRVIAAEHGDLRAGLLVEEAYGMVHFPEEERAAVLPALGDAVRPYLVRAYWHEGGYWGVVSVRALLASERFLNVAG